MQPASLKYSVLLYWNKNLVLDGKATAVTARDLARAHCVENFAGPTLRRWEGEAWNTVFSLGAFLTMEDGQVLSGGFEDSTGHAQFVIERL